MVDPISLALLGGSSIASLVVGRLSKREEISEPTTDARNKLHFINVGDAVNPNLFVKSVKSGDTFFLNIRNLLPNPEDLSDFLYNLEITSKRHNLTLKQISNELLILTHNEQKMLVGSVASRSANRDDKSKSKIEVMGG